jgi:hypothetical protein
MKCLLCGWEDDYTSFIYDYNEAGESVGLRCPDCLNDDPDEMDEDDIDNADFER